MRAVTLRRYGGKEVLEERDMVTPEPLNDEVQIKVAYAGINPVDVKIREGYLQARMPHQLPIIPGWDVSGIVNHVGSYVTHLKPGDAVYTYAKKPVIQWGTYAEYVCYSAKDVVKIPTNISLAEAAAIPLASLTAWQALFEEGNFRADKTILIQGGSGGVGTFAIQFAKGVGAKKIYATASPEKFDYIKSLGVDVSIDYKNESFVNVMKKLEPHGLDFVFDTVGGKTYHDSLQLIRKGGEISSILEPTHPEFTEKTGILTHYTFVRPSGHDLSEITTWIEQGKLTPPKIQILPLKEASTGQELVQNGKVFGKIVLQVFGG